MRDHIELFDGPPPTRSGAWRYPEVYRLQPGQSLLYRWPYFQLINDGGHSMRNITYYLRRSRGWNIRAHKTTEGIWIERVT